jgi:hypothetical protein
MAARLSMTLPGGIEIETSRELLSTTRRRTWWAISGFAPFIVRGQLQAGYRVEIVAVERDRDSDLWRE